MIDATLVAWRILRHNWRAIAAGAVIAWLGLSLLAAKGDARHWRLKAENKDALLTAERADRKAERADILAGIAATVAEHTAAARAAETRFAQIEREKDDQIRSRITAARALTAERLRAKAAPDHGAARATDLPGAADAAVRADGAGGAAFVDAADALICTENTVKLQGWIDWHKQVSETPR